MSRKPKPWYWKQRKCWMVTIEGVRHNLGPDKKEAEAAYFKLMAKPGKLPDLGIFALMDEFLEWTQNHRSFDTYEFYQARIARFASENPDRKCSEFKPFHVQKWLDAKEWSETYKAGIVTTLKRCFNWGVRQGYITTSPLRFLDKPKTARRDTPVTRSEYTKLLKNIAKEDPFHDLIEFFWNTGARPQEGLRFEAAHVDQTSRRIVMKNPKSRGPEWRVIHLNDKALQIISKQRATEGPVLKNSRGNPWTPESCSCRFKRLRTKVGRTIALYDFRHAYATDMLKAGVDPITVSELLGHCSLAMLSRHYQHVAQDKSFIHRQVNKRK